MMMPANSGAVCSSVSSSARASWTSATCSTGTSSAAGAGGVSMSWESVTSGSPNTTLVVERSSWRETRASASTAGGT